MQKFTIEQIEKALMNFFIINIYKCNILDPADFSDSTYSTHEEIANIAKNYLEDFLSYLYKDLQNG